MSDWYKATPILSDGEQIVAQFDVDVGVVASDEPERSAFTLTSSRIIAHDMSDAIDEEVELQNIKSTIIVSHQNENILFVERIVEGPNEGLFTIIGVPDLHKFKRQIDQLADTES